MKMFKGATAICAAKETTVKFQNQRSGANGILSWKMG